MKKRKRFRVIRNKALERSSDSKITAAEVEEIWRAGESEKARMAEICPEFNELCELVDKRCLESIEMMNLSMCLLQARLHFFELQAWYRQRNIGIKK